MTNSVNRSCENDSPTSPSTTTSGLYQENDLLPTPRANKVDGYSSPRFSPTLAQALTSSQAASPVSHSRTQASEEAQQTTAISGRKCCDLLEKYPRAGSSLKTCVASLLLGGGWYSSKCVLTWKAKATKCNRLLFQLVPSTPHTEEIGSGSSPTNRKTMIPTPQARDGRGAAIKTRDDLDSLIDMGATKGGVGKKTGLKLQADFVEWMMGYPYQWTDLNCQSPDIEWNVLKVLETV